jgi:elongation factor Ts
MPAITASMVADLRAKTDAPMMMCKKALTEADGDMAKAEELLRVKLGTKAAGAGSRVTAEGVIAAYVAGNVGAMIEVNCETDFVTKNDDFIAFAKSLAEIVATRSPANLEELGSIDMLGTKIESRRQALVQKIGENITLRRFKRLQAKGRLALYVHGGKIGVLVDFDGPEDAGKDLAMHIAFARPAYLSQGEIPQEVVADERRIQEARAKESGKPAEIAAKMAEGAVNKFLGEKTLLGQPFVKDDKQTVEKMLAARKAKVHSYVFFVVGEGIEKKSTDFAAEVMAQAGRAH